MLKEGQVRIPSGCAIAAIIDRKGGKINGSEIIKSIALMHDRSNGLGGGFAAYGIYPEHADDYAFHVFYDNAKAKSECEDFCLNTLMWMFRKNTHQKSGIHCNRAGYLALFCQAE